MYLVFLSHLSEDKSRVWSYAQAMLAQTRWDVFLDRPNDLGVNPAHYGGRIHFIGSGQSWAGSIDSALSRADCVVGLLSSTLAERRSKDVRGDACDPMIKELAFGLGSTPAKSMLFAIDALSGADFQYMGARSTTFGVDIPAYQVARLDAMSDEPARMRFVIDAVEDRKQYGLRASPASPGKASSLAARIAAGAKADARINRLPALFETDQTLPMATAYVDLFISAERMGAAAPNLLERPETLAERLMRREAELRSARRAPRHLLDAADINAVVLGAPGAGKSSLLRRIALEIASGQWKHFVAPVFVEARRYWTQRQRSGKGSLLEHAVLDSAKKAGCTDSEALDWSRLLSAGAEPGVILLVDGLDEIAGDKEAVDSIYNELEGLSGKLPWIATCRPAGFMRSVGESLRLEVSGLDDESIESLIVNWAQARRTGPAGTDLANALAAEVFGSPTLRQMARNPFLLTALCFLKGAALGAALPASRVAVFEALLDKIALQVQRRHNDPLILDQSAYQRLEGFCLSLYRSERGPVQLFTEDDWRAFAPDVDFQTRVLPARLITSWSENDAQFHFIHLSLQEHLIARAMLASPFEDALAVRFLPAWRSAFRSYTALLYETGRHDEFGKVVSALFEHLDVNGFLLISLAEIFGDAGVRDTTPWIECDLAEKLAERALDMESEISEALLDALAAFDPGHLERLALEAIAEMDETIARVEDQYPESFEEDWYPGKTYAEIGNSGDQDYRLLAKTRSPLAHDTIRAEFFGANQKRAMVASMAFADIARPSDRARVIDLGRECDMFGGMAARIFAFVCAAGRPEFAPFLDRVVEWALAKGERLFDEALDVLVDVGGTETIDRLAEISRSLQSRGDQSETFKGVLRRISTLGGEQACRILDGVIGDVRYVDWRFALLLQKMIAGASDETFMLEALDNEATRSDTIIAIATACQRQRLVSPVVLARLTAFAADLPVEDLPHLAQIEILRADGGRKRLMSQPLAQRAGQIVAAVRAEPPQDPYAPSWNQLRLLFDAFIATRFAPAVPIAFDLAASEHVPEDIRTYMIESASAIMDGDGSGRLAGQNGHWIKLLTNLLFDADHDFSYAAAQALGRIDLGVLMGFRTAHAVETVLEQLSAEHDLLAFEDRWIDRSGVSRATVQQRKIVMHVAADDDGDSRASLMRHFLTEHGFGAGKTISEEENAAAVLFYPPTTRRPEDEERRNVYAWAKKRFKKGSVKGVQARIVKVALDRRAIRAQAQVLAAALKERA